MGFPIMSFSKASSYLIPLGTLVFPTAPSFQRPSVDALPLI
jgi:hypothetical protein